ncbi:MAG: hypothetical protein IJ728_06320 [Selenomonadaceae bacterium]|nr:hypothetical protein [Selenomonadaceae bacterium]
MSVEVWTDTAKLMLIPIEEIKKRFGKFEYKFLQYILNTGRGELFVIKN